MKKLSVIVLAFAMIIFSNCSAPINHEAALKKIINGEIISINEIVMSLKASPDLVVVSKTPDNLYQLQIYTYQDNKLEIAWALPEMYELLSRPEISITDINNDKVQECYYQFQSGIDAQIEYTVAMYIPLSARLLIAKVTPGKDGKENKVELLMEQGNPDFKVYNDYLLKKGAKISF